MCRWEEGPEYSWASADGLLAAQPEPSRLAGWCQVVSGEAWPSGVPQAVWDQEELWPQVCGRSSAGDWRSGSDWVPPPCLGSWPLASSSWVQKLEHGSGPEKLLIVISKRLRPAHAL